MPVTVTMKFLSTIYILNTILLVLSCTSSAFLSTSHAKTSHSTSSAEKRYSHITTFTVTSTRSFVKLSTSSSASDGKGIRKGFGPSKAVSRPKSEGQVKREKEASKYDEISREGGQEYTVFVRQFGGDDKTWLPCGAIAVPRGEQVSKAIFANEAALKEAIVRVYPKLRGSESEFEFGFNLKVYPDDPIEVARKGSSKSSGFSIGNWVSTLLSPVDASEVKRPIVDK